MKIYAVVEIERDCSNVHSSNESYWLKREDAEVEMNKQKKWTEDNNFKRISFEIVEIEVKE